MKRGNHNLRTVWVALIAGIAVCAAFVSAEPPRSVIVHVAQPDLAWADSRIALKLDQQLSCRPWLRVITADRRSSGKPAFPGRPYDPDSLRDWGLEFGGAFLLFVDVHDERLECRQTLGLPLVMHRYETMAVIEGETRLLDLRDGRLVMAEPFRIVEKAARVFQTSLDDDMADPDLKLSAPAKIRLFDRLETRMVDGIVRRVEPILRGDD